MVSSRLPLPSGLVSPLALGGEWPVGQQGSRIGDQLVDVQGERAVVHAADASVLVCENEHLGGRQRRDAVVAGRIAASGGGAGTRRDVRRITRRAADRAHVSVATAVAYDVVGAQRAVL